MLIKGISIYGKIVAVPWDRMFTFEFYFDVAKIYIINISIYEDN